jgi:(1->4)-alpha-D-glucan 1-alpha-D-glucosylmutase
MMAPTATYRLQLRGGMTFEKAASLVPYLADLGVSHLYLSPIFQAAQGSTHGYDVTDCNRLDPVLGGDAGFACLSDAIRRHGLGLIVDFVPNHMAATPQNRWWRDILEWGSESAYVHHFDIDWSAPRLILPILSEAYGDALLGGAIGLSLDHEKGELGFTLGDLVLPAAPASYAVVLSGIECEAFGALAREFATATSKNVADLKRSLARLLAEPEARAVLDRHLHSITADSEFLHALHERQVWRLAHWRAARESLTYRRFFEISDLVGLKVERPEVFRDVHARLLELVGQGMINGIRLDHIDGLADPKAYLDRLQAALGTQAPFCLIVEKILGPGETLSAEWPVAGTTGYEFAKAVTDVLVDTRGESGLTAAYHAFISHGVDYDALALDAKRRILANNLAGELNILTAMAQALAQRDLVTRDLGADTLRAAIIELAAGFTVYRTYVDAQGPRDNDRLVIATAAANAKATGVVEDEAAVDFLIRLLLLEPAAPEERAGALAFATRFQQTSGPVMAKALEDTTFYRYTRLIALNEVGGEPQHFGAPVDAFHREMTERGMQQPAGLNATSTHDTKRGEDARARLCVLSEAPLLWAGHVTRWSDLNAHLGTKTGNTRYPDRNTEWLFYQALLGAWPMALDLADGSVLSGLRDRVAGFMLKAVREAKVRTTWTAQDRTYEGAIQAFTRNALDLDRSRPFLVDFSAAVKPFIVAGALNSFSQTLIKLVAPGVPDIYQGAESWDLSLVDPDNRRPVDFEQLANQLPVATDMSPSQLCASWQTGLPKLYILSRGMALRSEDPRLCAEGAYVPLALSGPQARCAVAFARVLGDQAIIAVVPRHAHVMLDGVQTPHVPSERWRETAVPLPDALAKLDWHDWLADAPCPGNGRIDLKTALMRFPVALLTTRPLRRP